VGEGVGMRKGEKKKKAAINGLFSIGSLIECD
jgi:hypothetical protein